jgi:NAD(P)-dependent dehydrogenase (short-subunit alcohol dehydrogenase family)
VLEKQSEPSTVCYLLSNNDCFLPMLMFAAPAVGPHLLPAPPTTAHNNSQWTPNDPEGQKARKESIAAKLPAGKVGEIDEVARVVIGYITSPFATGEVFHVNGGAFLV